MADPAAYEPNQPTRFESSDIYNHSRIPPAMIGYECGKAVLRLPSACAPFTRPNFEYWNPQFIRNLASITPLDLEHSIRDWNYRNRSSAQSILPFLLLAPLSFARDEQLVRAAGITMMIAVRDKASAEKFPNMMNPVRFPSTQGLVTATFDISTAFDAMQGRSSIIKTMNDHLEASCGGSQISSQRIYMRRFSFIAKLVTKRSPILVAMYLMVVWGLDGNSAYQMIQDVVFGIGMSSAMVTMLATLTQLCNAERQVLQTRKAENMHPALHSSRATKRTIDDAYESEDDGGDTQNRTIVKTRTRAGTAPFKDKSDLFSKQILEVGEDSYEGMKLDGHDTSMEDA